MEFSGLFLGLGNPGATYAATRHNLGFMVADALLDACARHGDVSSLSGGKKKYEAWKCRLPSPVAQTWIIAKPQTYMNKSGEAAVPLLQYYHIPIEHLFVAHDELDLPLGKMRLKFAGGAAGHNGIKSLVECTGTQNFHRLRLGIDKPAEYDVSSYVLGRFSSEESKVLEKLLPAAVDVFFRFCHSGFKEAQQVSNAFTFFSG